MKRRAFLVATALAPLAARSQPAGERVRRIGALIGYSGEDAGAQGRLAAFKEQLAARGWEEGRNLEMEVRWSDGDVKRAAELAKEIVAQQPDIILAQSTPVTAALLRETRSIPIVFTVVSDPVGSKFVDNLSRPGGNVTGFVNIEASLAEKWVQLLSQTAPRVKRVAVMFNPETAPYAEYYLPRLNAAADALGLTSFMATVRKPADIEELLGLLGRDRTSGLVTMVDSFLYVHRKAIISQAARRKVPAMYFSSDWANEGGLVSYGVDVAELFRRAAAYVDRILRGAKPAELPVEQPSKFELVINAHTAKALGLAIPQTVRLRADKVIE
jgi:putative ABC transport system substrate-binding protein